MLRLQKYIADCGIASRRKAEELILRGKVKINGKLVGSSEMGIKIDPSKDRVEVEGKVIRPQSKKVYLRLNKPRGYISSCRSEKGERTILDLIREVPERLYPVGRLDLDSEGLILLTNDGELANRLMHPRYEHEKEYNVIVQSPISNIHLKSLSGGIEIEGKRTLPARIIRIGSRQFSIILREGRKRQIRKMVEALGNEVISLTRVRIGNIQLGSLPTGKYSHLSPTEVRNLKSSVL